MKLSLFFFIVLAFNLASAKTLPANDSQKQSVCTAMAEEYDYYSDIETLEDYCLGQVNLIQVKTKHGQIVTTNKEAEFIFEAKVYFGPGGLHIATGYVLTSGEVVINESIYLSSF